MRHVVLTVHRCIVSRELNNETLLAPTCVISRCPWQLVGGLKFFVDEPVLGSSLKSLFNRCVSIESVDSHCRFLRDLASSELTKSTVYNIYFLRTSHIHIFPEKGVAMSSSDKGCLQMRTRNIKTRYETEGGLLLLLAVRAVSIIIFLFCTSVWRYDFCPSRRFSRPALCTGGLAPDWSETGPWREESVLETDRSKTRTHSQVIG